MAFRFLHTADWQVGKPFGNFRDDAGGRIAGAAESGPWLRSPSLARDAGGRRRADRRRRVRHERGGGRDRAPHPRGAAGLPRPLGLPAGQSRRGPRPFGLDADRRDGSAGQLDRSRTRPEPIVLGKAVVLPASAAGRRREALDQTEWFDTAATADGHDPPRPRPWQRRRPPAGRERGRERDRGGPCRDGRACPTSRSGTGTARRDRAADLVFREPRSPIATRTTAPATSMSSRSPGRGRRPAVEPVATGHYTWIRREVELVDGRCDAALAVFDGLAGRTPAVRRVACPQGRAEPRRAPSAGA